VNNKIQIASEAKNSNRAGTLAREKRKSMFKSASKMMISALLCGAMFAAVSCGGGSSVGSGSSVGKDMANDLCECLKPLSDQSGFEALACMLGLIAKYEEQIDGEGNFKDSKVEKDFLDAVRKCAPEFARAHEGNRR